MCNRVAFYKYCLLNRDFESSKIISLGNSIVPDSENVKAPIHPHKQDNLAWEHDPSNRKTEKRIHKKSCSRFLIVDQCPPDKNIRQNLSRSCDTTKHQQGNGQAQYQRAGTTTRKIITMVGELNLRLSKVKDTDNNTTSIPFYQCITFDGKRMYQPDIAMATVDLAGKLSYRDVVKAVSLLIDIAPTPTTINQRVIEYGEKIPINSENANISVGICDGTKCHTQEPGYKENNIHVVMGIDNGEKPVIGVTVNKPWDEIAEKVKSDKAFAEYASFVSDGEKEIRTAFSDGKRHFQLDLIHAFRILAFKLWEDKRLDFEERKQLVNDLKMVVLSLKNVVVYHKDDIERIKAKISSTVDEFKRLAKELHEKCCYKAAKFIRDYSNSMVTFAKLAVEGIEIPWNSNVIERLMGEISKRIKHKWMRWTTRGLESILRLILVRYTNEPAYNAFRNEIMGRSTPNPISCVVSVKNVLVESVTG